MNEQSCAFVLTVLFSPATFRVHVLSKTDMTEGSNSRPLGVVGNPFDTVGGLRTTLPHYGRLIAQDILFLEPSAVGMAGFLLDDDQRRGSDVRSLFGADDAVSGLGATCSHWAFGWATGIVVFRCLKGWAWL